jgi:DNA-directed RNA polymerase specialized sigma24 family protein
LKNRYNGIEKFIVTVIEKESQKLKGRFGIGADDLDDITQELHHQVWKKMTGAFAPHHPDYKAAVRRTVDAKIKDLIECREAIKRRTNQNNLHLEGVVVGDDEEITFGEATDLEHCREFFGDAAPAWHKRRHAPIDMAEALDRLPDDLRRLADAIEKFGDNYSEVQRQLGITRKRMRCDLKKLRKLMRELLDL